MFWNLGIGVRQVWVDRSRLCGHASALRYSRDRRGRVGYAIACVAGLAAQSYLEPKLLWEDVLRSFGDFGISLADFLPPGELTDGEQLGVAIAVTKRVAILLNRPELKRQINALVPALMKHGVLLHRQVESILQALPESPAARRMSRELVEELELNRSEYVESARGYAPDFRWNPEAS